MFFFIISLFWQVSADPAPATPRIVIILQGIEKQSRLAKNVQSSLENASETLPTRLDAPTLKAFCQNIPEKAQSALEPFGFFNSIVTCQVQTSNGKPAILVQIETGPAVHINALHVQLLGPGSKDPLFQKAIQNLPLKIGDTLQIPAYQAAKQIFFNVASSHGYFDAKMVKNKIVIHLAAREATIILVFNTGYRYHFGNTYINKTPFKETFLRKYLDYKPQQPFLDSHLEKTHTDFSSSSYFSQVNITPIIGEPSLGYAVPVKINLQPRKPKLYTLGLGYGTDTGPRALLGFNWRYIGQTGNNFTALLQASTLNNSLTASYNIPGHDPLKDLYSISAGIGRIDTVSGSSNSAQSGVSYNTVLGENWRQTFAAHYLSEKYQIDALPQITANLFYPSAQWGYVQVDKKLKPAAGISFNGSLSGTPGFLSTESAFVQLQTNLKMLQTWQNTHTRFIEKLGAGHTVINNINHPPYSLQLFLGGAQSLRGYSYNALGPGSNMIIGSIEVQQKVYKDLYIAGFYDTGNVVNGNPFTHLQTGTGPGLMWLSPVGMLELTIARAISQPHKPWIFQFNMGPAL